MILKHLELVDHTSCRAPEILLSFEVYGEGVDMWASGCVMGEMFLLKPLFPGEDDIDGK